MKTCLFSLVIAFLLGACLTGCGRGDGPRPLVVGMNLAYPPFEMMDTSGQPSGFSVELANALGESLGREVEIRDLPFSGLIPALRTGRIDLIISSMTVTPKRAQVVAFSDPYLRTGLSLLVGADAPVHSIADLQQPGRPVVVLLGNTSQVYAEANLPAENIRVLEREDAAVLEIVQGRADAFIIDQLTVHRLAGLHPDATRPILEAFQEEEWAIAVRPDDPELLAQVNAFIAKFRAEGGFDRLADTHLGGMKEAFAAQGIPFIVD